jgi:hypothetical protein
VSSVYRQLEVTAPTRATLAIHEIILARRLLHWRAEIADVTTARFRLWLHADGLPQAL